MLAELSGAILKHKFATFRVVPYHSRNTVRLKITEFIDASDYAGLRDDGSVD